MSTVVMVGKVICQDCGAETEVRMSEYEARVHASTVVAATTPGMLPVDGRALGVRGHG